jgi:hypothetical protein
MEPRKCNSRGSPRRGRYGGRASIPQRAWCVWSCRGRRTGQRDRRVVREPGRPCRSPCVMSRKWGPADEPQARGWASWTDGSEATGATQGSAKRRQRSAARGAQGVAQHHSIVPWKPGNAARRTRWREGRCGRTEATRGTRRSPQWLRTLSPQPRCVATGRHGWPLRRRQGRAASPPVDEPYALIGHVRICGSSRGQPLERPGHLLPGLPGPTGPHDPKRG